jgi:branched-chain amino acid transport system substrate-binding protein
MSTFFPGDPRPEVQAFVKAYRAKYDADPDSFSAGAYDTMVLFAALCDKYGTTREAMQTGLTEIKDVPSVIYGTTTFDPVTRRVPGAAYKLLLVKGGQFTVWDGSKTAAG